jgi:DNA-binding GntR family transcriptional regulator
MATKNRAPGGVSRQVLADHVYEALLVALMDGRLEAGTPVSIDGMARELDVSPTPVREALARLEATGMVRRMALRGYRVAPLFTPEELADLMDARLVIEPANAFMACKQADQELTGQLQQAIEDLKAAPRGPSFAEFRAYWEADERFHRLIAESADNQFLLSAYNALGGQVQRFRFFGGLGVTDADYAIAEHTEILKAFEAGDAGLARQKMIDHIEGVKQRSQHDSEVRS